MNEVTQCAGPVSTNAGLISCAGVTGSGCITYHAYATLLYVHVHVDVDAICMCTCTCNSCPMVFTVYGICTARGWYYPMHCENHGIAVLHRQTI